MTSRGDDFFDHFLVAVPGFSGKVLAFGADGVTGVLFDRGSLARLNADWRHHAAGLPEQFVQTCDATFPTVAGVPYTVALMSCLERVGQHMRAHFPSEEVYYWFEAGNGQAEANDFVRRAYKNPKTRERFRIAGWSFIAKDNSSALRAADVLALAPDRGK